MTFGHQTTRPTRAQQLSPQHTQRPSHYVRKEVICYSLAQTSTEIVMDPWATRSTRSQLSPTDTQSCLTTVSGQETRCPGQTASQIITVSRQNCLTLEACSESGPFLRHIHEELRPR
jgi:hypothetical protein